MKVSFLFTFIFLGFSFYVYAQSKHLVVSGKVVDEEHSALEAVTVALLRHRDSSYIRSVITRKPGVFNLTDIRPGEYDLLITKVGCRPVKMGPYQLQRNGPALELGTIVLPISTTHLNEIIVTDRKGYMDVRADKTVVNVGKSILATGASVYDVLGNTPGVKLTAEGDVLLRANHKALIMINGKPVTTVSQDANAIIRNLQSADVERIELMPNPPASYEASGSGGVVNIILKKGKNEGLNGSMVTSAGYGRYGKLSDGVSLNYRVKKVNIFGGVSAAYNKTFREVSTDRVISNSAVNSYYCNNQRIRTLQYNIGADWAIDLLHVLGVSMRVNYTSYSMNKGTTTGLYDGGVLDSTLKTQSGSDRHFGNYNYNVNYSGAIGHTRQTLSADADFTDITRRSFEYFNSAMTRYTAGGIADPADTLRSIAPLEVQIKSLKADYTNPFTKNLLFKAGAKFGDTRSKYMQDFDVLYGGAYHPIGFLSSNFNYQEDITSAYASLQQHEKVFSYSIGLRMEHTYSNVMQPQYDFKRSYTNFFPSVQLTYNVHEQHQLLAGYSRRIIRPDYESLNPILSYQDRYNYLAGNPYLLPAYDTYIQLSDTYRGKYLVSLYADKIRDFFGFNFFYQDDLSKINFTTRGNLKHEIAYGIKLDVPFDVTQWWSADFNADASYQHYLDYIGYLNKSTKDLIFDLSQSIKIGKWVSADVLAHYESATFYGTNSIRPYYYINAGVSGRINSKASLALTANDIFNTRRDRYSSSYFNSNLTGYTKPETQWVRLTFTYRFGKGTVKAPRSHTAGNAEEVRRAGNGN